jgi:hypothetical protein
MNMNKATIHEHLSKLHDAGLVKRKEREGHKWVYYKLTWNGTSLLHPENTRIAIMFTTAITVLCAGIWGLIIYIRGNPAVQEVKGFLRAPGTEVQNDTYPLLWGDLETVGQDPLFLYIAIGCLIFFCILGVISIWRYRENKTQKL